MPTTYKEPRTFEKLGVLLDRIRPNSHFETNFYGRFFLRTGGDTFDAFGANERIRIPYGDLTIRCHSRTKPIADLKVHTYMLLFEQSSIELVTDEDSWQMHPGEKTRRQPFNEPHLRARVVNFGPDGEALLFLLEKPEHLKKNS